MPAAPTSSETASASPTYLEGTVIRSTGSWYDVQTDRGVVPSRVRGKFRLEEQDVTNPVAVGDRVTIRLEPDDSGLITEIHPRRNQLSRRAAGRRVGLEHVIAANIDMAWAVQSVRLPKINPGFIDRFIVMAEVNEITPGLVINKTDLLREKDRAEIDALHDLYAGLGYTVLRTSTVTGEGVEAFREALRDRTSVVAGPSGVGKSSLLNAVEPGLGLRTGEVSLKTRKGRHTTTYASLLPLSFGGFVVDTPGIREFGLIDLDPADLGHYFREFKPYLHDCHFPNCTHDHEPDCAVKAAVEEGHITEARYTSYLNILDSLHLGERDVGR
ncbi:ribosome small subunit-dependent GTPase A [Rhodothermaceae bacterium RA]|nr:ribosome small subunit-dependent GTPase A [Rhodothermaceae bacterium RA]